MYVENWFKTLGSFKFSKENISAIFIYGIRILIWHESWRKSCWDKHRVCLNFFERKIIIHFILSKTIFSMFIFGHTFKHLNLSIVTGKRIDYEDQQESYPSLMNVNAFSLLRDLCLLINCPRLHLCPAWFPGTRFCLFHLRTSLLPVALSLLLHLLPLSAVTANKNTLPWCSFFHLLFHLLVLLQKNPQKNFLNLVSSISLHSLRKPISVRLSSIPSMETVSVQDINDLHIANPRGPFQSFYLTHQQHVTDSFLNTSIWASCTPGLTLILNSLASSSECLFLVSLHLSVTFWSLLHFNPCSYFLLYLHSHPDFIDLNITHGLTSLLTSKLKHPNAYWTLQV